MHLALNWLHAGSAQRDKSVQGISASGAVKGLRAREDFAVEKTPGF